MRCPFSLVPSLPTLAATQMMTVSVVIHVRPWLSHVFQDQYNDPAIETVRKLANLYFRRIIELLKVIHKYE